MRCPVCGADMVLGITTNRNKSGERRVLEYYVSGAWKNKGSTVSRSNGVRTDYADKYVLERIVGFANNEVLIKQITEKINSKSQDTGAIQEEYQAYKSTLNSIQKKKSKVLTLYEDDLISKQDLSERLSRILSVHIKNP